MKVPVKPPNVKDIINEIANDKKKSLDILFNSTPTDAKGRYLHWDKMKYLKPPRDLTSEEWWVSTKIARQQISKKIDHLLDKQKKPVVFSTTDSVLRDLHWLDQNTSGSLSTHKPIINPQMKSTYLIRSLVEEAGQP